MTDLLPDRITATEFAGGGMLAAAVVAALGRRQRTRRRLRRPGAPLLLPEQALAQTELALRVAADVEGAEFARIALQLAGRAGPTPEVLGVRVGGGQIAIRFTDAPPPPQPPFRSVGDEWVLSRRAITEELISDATSTPVTALPLITLGTTDEGETVLLNLRGAGTAALAGSRELVLGFLAAAATELANGDWIKSGRLVVVGVGQDLGGLPGVVAASTLEGIGALHVGDVLVSVEPPGALAETLPPGVALLALGPVRGTSCRMVIGDDRLEADVLDAVVRTPKLAPEQVAAIANLLEPVADAMDDEAAVEEIENLTPEAASEPIGAVAEPIGPPAEPIGAPEVEVRILGPVEIVGGERPITRTKSIELVVYLATHKECLVDADRLREALWPGRPPGTTLYTTASVARSHLGRASDGSQHLPFLPNGERVYRVGTAVGTDYERFAEGVRRAKSEPPAEAMRSLRSALELVRGRPFESASRGFEWTYVEGFQVCLENEIAAASHQLACLCLEAGDAEGARWATRQGLRASTGNEQLYRDAMRAADIEGNRAGVEALMNELSHVVEEDSPLEALHPETVALYAELTASGRAPRLARTGS